MTTDVARPLRNARAAVFTLFVVFGLAVSTWAVHIPIAQNQAGISTAMLGTMLLVLGASALVGMQLSGPLVSRFGGGKTAVGAGIVMSLLLTGPLIATDARTLGISLALYGTAMGATDVSMNAQAVVVEQDYGRPIMSAFHAVFSIGSVLGSLIGAGTLALGWSMTTTAVTISGGCLVLTVFAAPQLIRASRPSLGAEDLDTTSQARSGKRGRLLLLGALAFLLFLSEGAAMDWSSIHAQERLGVSPSVGALAFGSFVTFMTVGRFLADRVTARRGGQWVVRVGCGVAGVGIGIVVVSSSVPVTMIGWALFGLGLSGCIPLVLSTAGNLDGVSGVEFSRVVGMGYAALLAGPAVIGWVAEFVPLNVAMVIPLCAVVLCYVAAGAVTDRVAVESPDPAGQ